MLQNIHDRTKGWIAWIILSLVCLTFALWGIQSYLGGNADMDKLATVNGIKITQGQVNATYERLLLQQKTPITPTLEQKFKQEALQELISSQVFAQAAIATSYRFSEEQTAHIIRTMPTFQTDGQFSPTRFQDVLRGMLYSETNFIADIRAATLVNQPRAGLIASAFALPHEVDTALRLMAQTRDIRYLIIPAARFLSTVQVTDNEILAYYKKNQQRFKTPEQVSIEYLELSAKDLSDKQFAERSEQLTELTYTHPDSLAPAAKALGLTVQKTELFSKDAKKNAKIIAAAFSTDVLEQKNNSPLLEIAPDRVMVLRVNEHRIPAIQPLELVKKEILETLKLKAAQAQAEQLGKTALASLQKGVSPDLGIAWINKPAVSRDNDTIPATILNTAFGLPLSASTQVPLSSGDVALVSATKIIDGASKPTLPERVTAQNQLAKSYGEADYALYTRELMKNAKIEQISLKTSD